MSVEAGQKKVNYWTASGIMALIATCIIISLSGASIGLVNAMVTRLIPAMNIEVVEIGYCAMVVTAIGSVFAAMGTKVIDKLTPRVCLIVGCICEGAYMIIAGTTNSYPMFLAAGVIGGVGMGLGTIAACVGIADQFFGELSGRIAGALVAVMMFGTSFLTRLAAQLLETVDYDVILIGFGLVTAIGGTLVNLILIRKPTPEVAAHVAELKVKKSAKDAEAARTATGLTSKEAFRTPSFWLMALGMVFGAVILACFATYSAVFYTDYGVELTDATKYRSWSQFVCGLAVFAVGFIAAKFGPAKFLVIVYAFIILGCVFYLAWIPMQSLIVLLPAIILSSFDQCTTVAPANVLPAIFGRKDYVGINSAMMGFYYFGVFMSQVTSARILQFLGGTACMVWLAVCSLLSLIFFLLALKFSPYKKMQASGQES